MISKYYVSVQNKIGINIITVQPVYNTGKSISLVFTFSLFIGKYFLYVVLHVLCLFCFVLFFVYCYFLWVLAFVYLSFFCVFFCLCVFVYCFFANLIGIYFHSLVQTEKSFPCNRLPTTTRPTEKGGGGGQQPRGPWVIIKGPNK